MTSTSTSRDYDCGTEKSGILEAANYCPREAGARREVAHAAATKHV